MPLDPAAGFPLDPDAALRARVKDLERALEANPGAQAGGGLDTNVYSLSDFGFAPPGPAGPVVTLTIPEPGAFVQAYLEYEVRAISPGGNGVPGGSWIASARVLDDQAIAGTGGDDRYFGIEVDVQFPGTGISFPTNWFRAWQKAQKKTSALNFGDPPPGIPSVMWQNAGVRTYRPVLSMNGLASPRPTVEFRNLRLMVRVLQ